MSVKENTHFGVSDPNLSPSITLPDYSGGEWKGFIGVGGKNRKRKETEGMVALKQDKKADEEQGETMRETTNK